MTGRNRRIVWYYQYCTSLVLCLPVVKHNGNITMEQVIDIARTMRERSMAHHLSGTVKEILGTCQSIGCTVDKEHPHDKVDQINDGEITIPVSLYNVLKIFNHTMFLQDK